MKNLTLPDKILIVLVPLLLISYVLAEVTWAEGQESEGAFTITVEEAREALAAKAERDQLRIAIENERAIYVLLLSDYRLVYEWAEKLREGLVAAEGRAAAASEKLQRARLWTLGLGGALVAVAGTITAVLIAGR
jgi:hypothetical protein